MGRQRPVKFAILDASLDEASVNMNVSSKPMASTEVVNDRKRLIQPAGTAQKLYKDAQSVV